MELEELGCFEMRRNAAADPNAAHSGAFRRHARRIMQLSEPPTLELQRGELAVVVGQRGVEVRIVHRRTVVDGHEVDEAGRGEKRLVNRDLSQAVGPSQVLHGVPRPGRSAESGFNPRVSGLGNPRPE